MFFEYFVKKGDYMRNKILMGFALSSLFVTGCAQNTQIKVAEQGVSSSS